MKKKNQLIVIILLLILIVSGCSKKAVDAEKMSSIFIDKFLYDKESDDFEDIFVEGDILGKQLTLMTKTFEDTFSDVFDSITGELSDDEKNEISANLMKQVRKESSYTYSVKEVDKSKVEVTYNIEGFDYATLVENTLESVFSKLMKEESPDENQMKQGLLDSFDEALQNVKAVSEIVSVPIVFEKVKGKWQLYDNQDEELEQILLAFVAGVNDKEQYDKEMNDMLERAVKKATGE